MDDLLPTLKIDTYGSIDCDLKRNSLTQPVIVNPLAINGTINLKEILEHIEVAYIKEALDMANGVVTHAAEKLGLRRTTLVEKMKKHQLVR